MLHLQLGYDHKGRGVVGTFAGRIINVRNVLSVLGFAWLSEVTQVPDYN